MPKRQRELGKALQGNHGVWVHLEETKIAVWYGKWRVSVYNSETFEHIDDISISAAYDPDIEYEVIETAVDVSLSQIGYHRGKENKSVDIDGLYEAGQELDA